MGLLQDSKRYSMLLIEWFTKEAYIFNNILQRHFAKLELLIVKYIAQGYSIIVGIESYKELYQLLSVNLFKINKPPVHIRVNELYANPVANVNTLKAMHQSSFNGKIKEANPGAFGGGTGDDGIEAVPDF